MRRQNVLCLMLTLAVYLFFNFANNAEAATPIPRYICLIKKSGAIALRPTCLRGESKITNVKSLNGDDGAAGAQGAAGPTGATGPTGLSGTAGTSGADGSARVYGDGSNGALTVSSSADLMSLANGGNLQFTDLTIDSGVTLTTGSGVVIRASGVVTINGAINVLTGAPGGLLEQNGIFGSTSPAYRPAIGGNSLAPAGLGELGTNGTLLYGGAGGTPLTNHAIAGLFYPGIYGGGSGAPTHSSGPGGAGGGSIVILAKNGIVVNASGSITASGAAGSAGSGGGAGGVIILASATSVFQNGTLAVAGANGGTRTILSGSGGGGGGGLIRIISPSFGPIGGGTNTVTGGTGAIAAANGIISSSPRIGGGGGGACAGQGGSGADVNTNGSALAAENGGAGALKFILADPSGLF